MIVLDTHIWIWWVNESPNLNSAQLKIIKAAIPEDLGISAISCWEVAKLVEVNRLELKVPVLTWIQSALAYPGVKLLPLTPEIVVKSTQLPGDFHRDPADQIIVATALAYNCALMTADEKILDYPHVKTIDMV